VADFVAAVLDPAGSFVESLTAFVASILRPGLLNSIAQTLLKIAAPGVPDFYQGSELFEFQLVDPDNRGPVDFARRRALLSELAARARAGALEGLADELLGNLEDGRLKMFVTRQALRFRNERRALFGAGDYVPLQVAGPRQGEVVAVARTTRDQAVVAAAARFVTRLPSPPTGARAWGDSALPVQPGAVYREMLTGRELRPQRSGGGFELPLAEVFAHLPVALLERNP
jgi:(1->4)-alpha-D-glucan 1-alpha-D-glucosylmutase